MANTVTSQVLFNGRRHLVYRFTNYTDGSTNETAVTKIDATASINGVFIYGQTIVPGVHLKVTKVIYDVKGMGLRILWDATTDVDMLDLGGYGTMDFRDIGGLQNPLATGATGSILFTTDILAGGTTDLASYSVVLHCTKGVPQS